MFAPVFERSGLLCLKILRQRAHIRYIETMFFSLPDFAQRGLFVVLPIFIYYVLSVIHASLRTTQVTLFKVTLEVLLQVSLE